MSAACLATDRDGTAGIICALAVLAALATTLPGYADESIIRTVPADDARIRYVGRWQLSGDTATSAWNGAYLRTRFSGRSLHAVLAGHVDLCIIVDGCQTILTGVGGTADLLEGRPPLADGMHDLTVAACWDHDRIRLRGLQIDAGARLDDPAMRPRLIEFIGASSTSATGTSPVYHCTGGYAWLAAERLGAEHRMLCCSGKTLEDRPAYPSSTGAPLPSQKAGLAALFFKNQPLDAYPGPAGFADWQRWDDGGYPPADIVVCQVGGSNDCATSSTPDDFSRRVVSFARQVRRVYPRAHLVMLTPWYTFSDRSKAFVAGLRDAVGVLRAGLDGQAPAAMVEFVDATGWLVPGSDDYCADRGHPSNAGHRKAALRLAEAISGFTGIPLAPASSPMDLSSDAVAIDDGDDRFVWLGCYKPANDGWRTVSSPASYRGAYRLSVAADASFTCTFTGTFARIHGPTLPGCSSDVAVTIGTQLDDGSWVEQGGTFDQRGPSPGPGRPLYETPPLRLSKNGRHTLTLAARDGKPIALDRIEVGAK